MVCWHIHTPPRHSSFFRRLVRGYQKCYRVVKNVIEWKSCIGFLCNRIVLLDDETLCGKEKKSMTGHIFLRAEMNAIKLIFKQFNLASYYIHTPKIMDTFCITTFSN